MTVLYTQTQVIEKSLAWLVLGTINEHFPNPEETEKDPIMGTSGCIINCGPCGALHTLSQSREGRAEIERLIRLTGFQQGSWDYWDDDTDTLRWDWFQEFFAGHKGCSSVNGVAEPCHLEGEEPLP